METIEEKYQRYRPFLKDGDIILIHGVSLVSKIIESSDKNFDGSWAYNSHVGVIFESHGAFGICDANGNGVQWDRLSWRIQTHKGGDFTIIRPLCNNEEIQKALYTLFKRSDNAWIKYDFKNGFKELLNRRFSWKLKIYLTDKKYICSTEVAQYAITLKLVTKGFIKSIMQFPQDYERYLDSKGAKILSISK